MKRNAMQTREHNHVSCVVEPRPRGALRVERQRVTCLLVGLYRTLQPNVLPRACTMLGSEGNHESREALGMNPD